MDSNWSRRDVLKAGIASAGLLALGEIGGGVALSQDRQGIFKEVMFYEKQANNIVKCQICPKTCRVPENSRGYCGNKENKGGRYYNLAYAQAVAANVDPIEKKPFYHFLPGSKTFSIATAGCNFKCNFCQNWQISQVKPEQVENRYLLPETIVNICLRNRIDSIAFTYTEPIVFYGYMYDTAKLAKEKGVHSVMVSNGFINERPLRTLCQELSAVKVDLKGFRDEFYQKTCHGRLQPVLDTLVTLKDIGIWFEIVVLLIPALNDSKKELTEMCRWISKNLGADVPVHFSRFKPMYKLTNLPPTPVKILEQAWRIASDNGLKFIYLGNVAGHSAESTMCPACRKIVIRRIGYLVKENYIKKNKCAHCQAVMPGFWNKEGEIPK